MGGERHGQTVINETSRVCACVCLGVCMCNHTRVYVHEWGEPGCVHVLPVPCNVPATCRLLNTSVASPPCHGSEIFLCLNATP